MSNRPGAWQRRRPRKRPKAHRQACLGMRPGFSTLSRIMEELAELEEEEDRPRPVVDSPTTQWPPLASQTTLWELLAPHLQHLAQEALV